MTTLQSQLIDAVTLAGPAGLSLDDLASGYLQTHPRNTHTHARAAARAALRRLGAEGLVESLDGGENWRRAEG
jgi:hypothetical protein